MGLEDRKKKDLNILFITRKFPPTKGGMEKIAYELYKNLSEISNVELVKWGGSNKWLPVVFPYFLIKSLFILLRKRIDVIYLEDGMLSVLGLILKTIFNKPVIITIHGLDITYNSKFYQLVVPKTVAKLDRIICISKATETECIKREIPKNKISIIHDGISDNYYINTTKKSIKNNLEKITNLDLKSKSIILSVGRLTERKGFYWFIENVMPILVTKNKNMVYFIVGNGKLEYRIRNLIKERGFDRSVYLFTGIDDEKLKLFYNSADVFVMPNIPIKGDMEGFGVVVLEAGSCGVPVVASNLKGIKDAVKDGKNGFLVKPYNTNKFTSLIIELLNNNKKRRKFGKGTRKFVLETYIWKKIANIYLEVFSRDE